MGNKSAWETLAVSKDKQIAALTAEVTRLRALDAALRKISEARDDESTPAAMQRTAEDRTRSWMAEVEKRDAAIAVANARTERAIEFAREVEAWKLPMVPCSTPALCATNVGQGMHTHSYESEYGSNGVRDYFRNKARDLLRELDAEEGRGSMDSDVQQRTRT